MHKTDLIDLFNYTGFAWDQFREAVPDEADLVRAAPGSGWPALRNCLGHIVLAYERWVPAIIELKARPLPEPAADDFASWPQIQAYREGVRNELLGALEGWSDEELAAMHEVDVDGDMLRYSRAELVLHLLLHERGHHGDVTTLFWQLGIDADTSLEYRFHLQREG